MSEPSPAVIEAVEQAESRHTYLMFGECSCGYLSLEYKGWRSHRRVEVARAAEAAALKVAADECEANARDWYGTDIFRDVDSADLAAVRSAMQAKGNAAVVASTIRAVPHLDPDERDRLASDLARQCQQCTPTTQEKPCP
jgi:hypothetical protein